MSAGSVSAVCARVRSVAAMRVSPELRWCLYAPDNDLREALSKHKRVTISLVTEGDSDLRPSGEQWHIAPHDINDLPLPGNFESLTDRQKLDAMLRGVNSALGIPRMVEDWLVCSFCGFGSPSLEDFTEMCKEVRSDYPDLSMPEAIEQRKHNANLRNVEATARFAVAYNPAN